MYVCAIVTVGQLFPRPAQTQPNIHCKLLFALFGLPLNAWTLLVQSPCCVDFRRRCLQNTAYSYYFLSFFVFRFPCKIMYEFLISVILRTCPSRNCFHDFAVLILVLSCSLSAFMVLVTVVWRPGFEPWYRAANFLFYPIYSGIWEPLSPLMIPGAPRLELGSYSAKQITSPYKYWGWDVSAFLYLCSS